MELAAAWCILTARGDPNPVLTINVGTMTGKSREIADVTSVSQASGKRSGRIKKQEKLEMATICNLLPWRENIREWNGHYAREEMA